MHICLVAVYWTGIAGGKKNKKPGYTRVHLCVHLYNVKLKKTKINRVDFEFEFEQLVVRAFLLCRAASEPFGPSLSALVRSLTVSF